MFTPRKLLSFTLLLAFTLSACAGGSANSPVPAPTATAAAQPTATQAAPANTPAPVASPTPELPQQIGEFTILPNQPPPPSDYVDIVLTKVEAGEITYEQGLIAALQLYAGEPGALEVLGPTGPEGSEGNRLIGRVQNYLAIGSDEAAKAEMRRLLNIIAPNSEQLLPFAQPQPSAKASKSGLAKLGVAASQADSPDPVKCQELWAEGFPQSKQMYCFQYAEVNLSNGQGRVFYPSWWWPSDPSLAYAQAAAEALMDSDATFSKLGQMRSLDLVFSVLSSPSGAKVLGMAPYVSTGAPLCQVIIYPKGIADSLEIFKQTVAHEVFHCFQSWNFPISNAQNHAGNEWWVEGSAEYFSNIVYPTANDEWGRVDGFDQLSATKPLYQLSYENTVFFQYLGNTLGDAEIIAMLKSFPGSPNPRASADALAAYPAMQGLFHTFAEAWADGRITDTGGGYLPNTRYVPAADQLNIVGDTNLNLETQPLVLKRYLLTFTPETRYKVDATYSGAEGMNSARPEGDPGKWADPPTEVVSGCDPLIYLHMQTSAAQGADPHKGALHAAHVEDVKCDPKADAKTDTGWQGQTACDHPFMPLRPGATWTYASADGNPYTYAVTGVVGDPMSAVAHVTVTGPGTETNHVWNCAAGEGLLRYMVRDSMSGLAPVEASLAQASGVLLPRPDWLTPGAEWASLVSLDTYTTDPVGGSTTGGMTYEDYYTLVSTSPVTVGDQTFEGLQVAREGKSTIWFMIGSQTSKPIVRNKSETLVYAYGVGLVQSGTGELVSYNIP